MEDMKITNDKPKYTSLIFRAEVIGLLGLKPVMVDVDLNNFNISIQTVSNDKYLQLYKIKE